MIVCGRNSQKKTMEGIKEEVKNLEICSYRYLQQLAKAMGLPSNVKKVCLIKLINTKKYGSQEQVDDLVKQVRQERQQVSQVRRKANKKRKKTNVQQSTEISSTSNSLSPPITTTPTHTRHVIIRYSPEKHSPKNYPETISRKYNLSRSDRVLRSFNRVKKPSYLLNNTLFNLINGSDAEDKSEVLKVLKAEKTKQVDVFPKKSDGWKMNQLVPVTRNVHTSPPPRARVQRRISGVYPLRPEEVKVPNVAIRRADGSISKLRAIIQKPLAQRNYNHDRKTYNTSSSLLRIEASERSYAVTATPQLTYSSTYLSSNKSEMTPNLDYRQSNLSEDQHLSYRPSGFTTTPNFSFRSSNTSEIAHSMCYRTSNMTEITPSINYRVPNNSMVDMPQNNFNSSHSSEEINMSNVYKENQSEYSVYYHKKIRAEQVRSSRNRDMVRNEDNDSRLPKINEVFSKFSSVYSSELMQPLYVHVDNEPDFAPNTYIPDPTTSYQGSSALEKLYNVKTALPPLLRICTTNNTRTVYCTPVMTSAKAQPPNPMHLYNDALAPRDNQYYINEDGLPRVHDFFRNFHGDDGSLNDRDTTVDFRRSSSSNETPTSQEQELGANVTIPEMVEDALELISQDGDYMERMGMDIRMQCILCSWAGPKIILEYHIRKEHSEEIIQCSGTEWVATYTLGGLCAHRSWTHRVLQSRGELYVLSAKYQVPECFMASLSTLSEDDPPKTGSLTIYNKLTGEPFIWQGEVSEIDTDMDLTPNGLRIPLSKIDLLPNSANLQLVDRQLVMKSPGKVIVGLPDLDNIHISLVVKIFDSVL